MISGNTYEELYEILGYMDKLTVMKIPEEILKNIAKKRNFNYKTRIDKDDIFNRQNMSEETLELLCYIDYNYWMDEDKKEEIDRILKENEKIKREKYHPDNLFKKDDVVNVEPDDRSRTMLTQYKESVLKKLFKKILSIFQK